MKRRRWGCPIDESHRDSSAPANLRRSDIRRYCAECMIKGALVERVLIPRDYRPARRMSKAERYTWDGIDLLAEMNRIQFLPDGPPCFNTIHIHLVVRRCSRMPLSRLGHACVNSEMGSPRHQHEYGISVSVWPHATGRDALSTLVHELAHIAGYMSGGKLDHGSAFQRETLRIMKSGYGIDLDPTSKLTHVEIPDHVIIQRKS